jgi:arylformamidase
MSKIYDITIEMHKTMPAFPGDEAVFQMQELMNVNKGDIYSIKKLSMLTHTGTHIDAPSHFIPNSKDLNDFHISTFKAPAKVIEINDREKITAEELENVNIKNNTYVLFKTHNSYRWKTTPHFIKDYTYLTPEAALILAHKGIRGVGIDYLSIDRYDETGSAEAHLILLKNDILIIEGLDLSEVPQGDYMLTCLPLKISGIDGSPVRAILEEIN